MSVRQVRRGVDVCVVTDKVSLGGHERVCLGVCVVRFV